MRRRKLETVNRPPLFPLNALNLTPSNFTCISTPPLHLFHSSLSSVNHLPLRLDRPQLTTLTIHSLTSPSTLSLQSKQLKAFLCDLSGRLHFNVLTFHRPHCLFKQLHLDTLALPSFGKLQAPLATVIVALEEYPAMSTTRMPCADRRNGARKREFEHPGSE